MMLARGGSSIKSGCEMRIFNDPKTIGQISTVASALGQVASAIGGFTAASEKEKQAEVNAAALSAKAEQEKKLQRRRLEDNEKLEKMTLARMRAVFAAQAGDVSGANAISFLSQTAGEFAIDRFRLLADSTTTINSLLTEAQNELIFGKSGAKALRSAAVAKAGKSLTLIKGFPKTKTTSSSNTGPVGSAGPFKRV